MEKVYLQTYSVRDSLRADFVGSMKKIAAAGYTGVEFAGDYGGLSVADMKTLLADLGLDCICGHVPFDRTPGDIELFTGIGARYMVCPMSDIGSYDEVMRTIERLNELGKLCAASGMKYGYHNHTQEFAVLNGKYIMDHIIENTDPDNVIIELDIGWVTTAGVDAVEYIKKHAGRFELIHAKECGKVIGVPEPIDWASFPIVDGNPVIPQHILNMFEEEHKSNVKQGAGIVDWQAMKAAADAQGAVAYVVEREWDYAGDLWQCVTEDAAYMKTL